MASETEDELEETLWLRAHFAQLALSALRSGDVAQAREFNSAVRRGRLALRRLWKPEEDETIERDHRNISAWLRVMIGDLRVLLSHEGIHSIEEAVLTVVEQSERYPRRWHFGIEFGGALTVACCESEALLTVLGELATTDITGKQPVEKLARKIIARVRGSSELAVRESVTRHRGRARTPAPSIAEALSEYEVVRATLRGVAKKN